MAYFEKSLQAVATLDSVLTTANETFRTEQKKLLATLKDPTKQIGEMRKALTETEAEQKWIFRETVQAEFAAVRATVNAVVTTAPPPLIFWQHWKQSRQTARTSPIMKPPLSWRSTRAITLLSALCMKS